MTVAKNKAFIFGGLGSKVFNDVLSFDIGKIFLQPEVNSKDTGKWAQHENLGDNPCGIYGHSLCYFKKRLILFGGEVKFNFHLRQRECLCETRVYDIGSFFFSYANYFSVENGFWKNMRLQGDIMQPRRNHSATIVGRNMVVIGGINNRGIALSDLWQLDLSIFLDVSPLF